MNRLLNTTFTAGIVLMVLITAGVFGATAAQAQSIAITKGVDADSARPGDILSYSITISNISADGISRVEVYDQIPALTEYVDGTASHGGVLKPSWGALTWQVGPLASGDSVVLTFQAIIDSTITDTVLVTNSAFIPGGVDLHAEVTTVVIPYPPVPELDIDKEVDKSRAYPGDTLAYSLVVTNVGPIEAFDIAVIDDIPVNAHYLGGSADHGGVYDSINNRVTWSSGMLSVGEDVTLSFKAVIDNTAPVGSTVDNFGVIVEPDTVYSDTVKTTILTPPVPDLDIDKEVDKSSAYPGDTLAYSLVVANVGPIEVFDITVIDDIPVNARYLGGSADHGGVYDSINNRVTWSSGMLSVGEDVTLSFKAVIDKTAPAGSTVDNFGVIVEPDTVYSDTVKTTILAPPVPELQINKKVNVRLANRGKTLIYTLTVTNTDDIEAYGVEVIDTIPIFTTYIAGSAAGATYDSPANRLIWDVGTVLPGSPVDLEFKAVINDDAPVGDTIFNGGAIISPDTVKSNLVHTVITPTPKPELAIDKSVDSTVAYAGDTLTYSLTIENIGGIDAADVEIVDDIPALTGYVTGSVSHEGVYDSITNRLSWSSELFPVGEKVTLSFRAVIDADAPDYSTIDNFGLFVAPDTVVSDTVTTTVIPRPIPPQLTISKTVDSAEASPGSPLGYSLKVKNTGETVARHILVIDMIPDLTEYIPQSASHGGSYDAGLNRLMWDIDSLGIRDSIELTFGVTIDADIVFEDTVYNMAEIRVPVEEESKEVKTIVKIKTGSEDLILVKEVDRAEAEPSDVLTYKLTLVNSGPDLVSNVTLVDTIPGLTAYVNGSLTGHRSYGYDDINGIINWDVGDLGWANLVELEFQVRIDNDAPDGAEIPNQAYIISPDTIPGNRVVTTVRVLPPPDFNLSKSADPTRAAVGDTVQYTIIAVNTGDGPLYEAVLEDDIPEYFRLVESSVQVNGSGVAAGDGDTVFVDLGTVDSGDSLTITYLLRIENEAGYEESHTNTAWLRGRISSGSLVGFGPVQATVSLAQPELKVTKRAGSASGLAGSIIRYTVTVENSSDVSAHNVTVHDEMPDGFFYMEGTTQIDGIAAADPSGTTPHLWQVGSLAPGEMKTIRYAVLLGASVTGGIHENRAWAIGQMPPFEIRSNIATARVSVLSTLLNGAIRGRIVVDCDGDGVADVEEAPSAIDIYLDDGSQSRSNSEGMFYFGTVRAGEHTVVLDERDLDGFVLADGAEASVFAYVHERGESYVTFRVCPSLLIGKQVATVPRVKVTKAAIISEERTADTGGVRIDYEITVASNGGVDPTLVRVIDSFPSETRLIIHENQELMPEQSNNILTYDLTVEKRRLRQSVFYSLEDLAPGVRRFLTNKIHLEGSPVVTSETTTPIVSEPTEVSVGPFRLIPPEDIEIDVIGAHFKTSKADILPDGFPILRQLADSAKKYDGADIKVEGHADIRRIHTKQFPSNWELSEARAKSVVDWLAEHGVDTVRMTYEGFAATRPIDSALNLEAWAKNRRVEVFLKARTESRVDLSAITSDRWEASTMLELVPVYWDTLAAVPEGVLEAGFDDAWEVIIKVENTGGADISGLTVSDVLPDGAEMVEGSALLNGLPVSTTVTGKNLSWTIEKLEASAATTLRYRIRALPGERPSGGGPAVIEATGGQKTWLKRTSNPVLFD